MSNLPADHQVMLATWQQHAHAEFVLKDADAALATMTENPHVILIPSGTGGNGWASVHAFYAHEFLPNIPPDFEFSYISQIFCVGRIVYEVVVRFTHTLSMDWMIPGVPPTGRPVEFPLAIVIQIQGGKVASEHFYWDQATVLFQLGVLNLPVAAAGIGSVAQLRKHLH